jgi:hypothetical protein
VPQAVGFFYASSYKNGITLVLFPSIYRLQNRLFLQQQHNAATLYPKHQQLLSPDQNWHFDNLSVRII